MFFVVCMVIIWLRQLIDEVLDFWVVCVGLVDVMVVGIGWGLLLMMFSIDEVLVVLDVILDGLQISGIFVVCVVLLDMVWCFDEVGFVFEWVIGDEFVYFDILFVYVWYLFFMDCVDLVS